MILFTLLLLIMCCNCRIKENEDVQESNQRNFSSQITSYVNNETSYASTNVSSHQPTKSSSYVPPLHPPYPVSSYVSPSTSHLMSSRVSPSAPPHSSTNESVQISTNDPPPYELALGMIRTSKDTSSNEPSN